MRQALQAQMTLRKKEKEREQLPHLRKSARTYQARVLFMKISDSGISLRVHFI